MEFYGNIELIFSGKNIDYVLSAGIDLDKDGDPKYMPSLSFYEDYGLHAQATIESWDNDTYLIETLLENVLIPWNHNKVILDGEEFAALIKIKGLDIEDLLGLQKLINKAIDLELFEDYYKEKENGTK